MKLKTLKDLEIAGHEVIREEAIKWVKKKIKKYGFEMGCIVSMDMILFHNITEEDLKKEVEDEK